MTVPSRVPLYIRAVGFIGMLLQGIPYGGIRRMPHPAPPPPVDVYTTLFPLSDSASSLPWLSCHPPQVVGYLWWRLYTLTVSDKYHTYLQPIVSPPFLILCIQMWGRGGLVVHPSTYNWCYWYCRGVIAADAFHHPGIRKLWNA